MTRTGIFLQYYAFAPRLSNWLGRVRPFLLAAVLGFLSASLWAADYLADGEKALGQNDLAKAQTYLEAALAQGPANERLYLDLGLTYLGQGIPGEARKMFRKGADLEGPQQFLLLYNLGLSAVKLKDLPGAEAAFSQVLQLRPYPEALRVRGMTRLEQKNWPGAIDDLSQYQTQAPANPQKDKIDKVLAYLKEIQTQEEVNRLAEITRKKQEEERKKAEEEQAKLTEEKRKADEEARKAEEARIAEEERKKQEEILARVRDSLQGAGGDSKALKTGPAGVKSEEGDFTLE